MGNRVSPQPHTSEPTLSKHKWPVRVRIGILCMDFTQCKHFVHVEGVSGWAVYDANQIVKRFLKNPEHFSIDSKFMPELEITRPDATHFEFYNSESIQAEDPDKVMEMHIKAKRFEQK